MKYRVKTIPVYKKEYQEADSYHGKYYITSDEFQKWGYKVEKYIPEETTKVVTRGLFSKEEVKFVKAGGDVWFCYNAIFPTKAKAEEYIKILKEQE